MRALVEKITLVLLAVLLAAAFSGRDYEHLYGTKAKAWTAEHWLNTAPLELADLRGKVLLVRWWTGPYCPFCRASSAALNQWYEAYKDEGLVVVGFYHHKARSPLFVQDVETLARKMGFTFPLAIDPNWTTLKRWWLDPVPEARFTSVTFLVDHEGIIRHIHPGGQYVEGDAGYAVMQAAITEQLARIELSEGK